MRRFFPRKRPVVKQSPRQQGVAAVPLRIPGLEADLVMRVHDTTDLHISEQIRSEGIWEEEETRLLMSLLREGHTFVDVGANIGYFTLLGAALVGPTGKVFAFEPDPDNCRLLLENCQLNSIENTLVEEVALSDHAGSGELFLSEDNLGDHTIYGAGDSQRRKRSIRLVAGSEYFGDKAEVIDVIKVDVQGAEFQVLRGLESTLRASLPGLILVLEFSPNSLRAAGSDGEALLQLLLDLALRFYIFDHRHQRLLFCEPEFIGKWVRLTQMDPSSEGFINLVCSGAILSSRAGIEVENNEQGVHDPLEYLLASHLQRWDGARCDITQMNAYLYLSLGWCFPEPWGVWSEGEESRIRFYPLAPPGDVDVLELCFEGQYYGTAERTKVVLCGQLIGEFDLVNCRIKIPAALLRQDDAQITLLHKTPQSPREMEGVQDDRQIKYGLRSLAWTAL